MEYISFSRGSRRGGRVECEASAVFDDPSALLAVVVEEAVGGGNGRGGSFVVVVGESWRAVSGFGSDRYRDE